MSIHLDPESIAAEVRAFRPEMLSGYPNMLAFVCDVLQRDPVLPPTVRVALTGAESLTPDLRRKIEGRLGVPVRDQERIDSVTLRLVPRTEPTRALLERLRFIGAELLGTGVDFDLLIVDKIPPEVSGKYRPARSHVASSDDGVALPMMGS